MCRKKQHTQGSVLSVFPGSTGGLGGLGTRSPWGWGRVAHAVGEGGNVPRKEAVPVGKSHVPQYPPGIAEGHGELHTPWEWWGPGGYGWASYPTHQPTWAHGVFWSARSAWCPRITAPATKIHVLPLGVPLPLYFWPPFSLCLYPK